MRPWVEKYSRIEPCLCRRFGRREKNTDWANPIARWFHLIAVRDRRGDQSVVITEYRARHILIKPDAVRSPEKAEALAQNVSRELQDALILRNLLAGFLRIH